MRPSLTMPFSFGAHKHTYTFTMQKKKHIFGMTKTYWNFTCDTCKIIIKHKFSLTFRRSPALSTMSRFSCPSNVHVQTYARSRVRYTYYILHFSYTISQCKITRYTNNNKINYVFHFALSTEHSTQQTNERTNETCELVCLLYLPMLQNRITLFVVRTIRTT